jgi:hypothetical protein
MNIKEIYLNQFELLHYYNEILNGKISKTDLAETQKAQLIDFANNRKAETYKNLNDSLLNGIITLSMIGNDFDSYFKSQTKSEQIVIDWLTSDYNSITIEPKSTLNNIEISYQAEQKRSNLLFENCEIEANKMIEIEEQIEFWYKKKNEYLKSLDFITTNVSGIITSKNGTEIELFFDKLVSNKIKELREKQRNTSNDNQNNLTETEQETITFENNFDKVDPILIYKHFKAGLVDKKYLTDIELNEYLKSAFELKNKPKPLFKFNNAPLKREIQAVFYNYFISLAGKPHGKQRIYAALLGDYFIGYNTKNVSTNFNKTVY